MLYGDWQLSVYLFALVVIFRYFPCQFQNLTGRHIFSVGCVYKTVIYNGLFLVSFLGLCFIFHYFPCQFQNF